ncbi:rhodanese-related sulfurtransferase [Azomonas agilis]|uniref:Rhodanese-related sulfurtransferase n=1 Tax=Azomonas agilis TaxID=116849 RepID=A0A562IYW4_9GAMM|nr:rhodanese-like domain-containing protein [Azomonas agilis]TWH76199.1 rhodanese-related sulfurtransferase [Azomonas agilis]
MKTAHDLVTDAKAQIHEISPEEAVNSIQQADLLLDVREASEYQTGHIPTAINIPRGLLEFKLESTPELSNRALKIVLYCKTSGRAALSALTLKHMGYQQVQSIAGGFDAWIAAGKPQSGPDFPHFE